MGETRAVVVCLKLRRGSQWFFMVLNPINEKLTQILEQRQGLTTALRREKVTGPSR